MRACSSANIFAVLHCIGLAVAQHDEQPTAAPTSLSSVFGSDWLAHTEPDNPHSCGSQCLTAGTPWASQPKYEGSVNLSLTYRSEDDDRLYSSDGGVADRADRFNNTHYFRSGWYFDFDRTAGEWFERPYSISRFHGSSGGTSLPSSQILYGDAPVVAQRSYNGGEGLVSRGVLELTTQNDLGRAKSGALVVKVVPTREQTMVM